jgi:hypothetical protein
MVNDDDIIEIVLSESNEQDTNDCNSDSEVSETPKKISFEAALTALKTMTEFIEQQPDNSFVAREDVANLQRLRRNIELSRVENLRQDVLDRFVSKLD